MFIVKCLQTLGLPLGLLRYLISVSEYLEAEGQEFPIKLSRVDVKFQISQDRNRLGPGGRLEFYRQFRAGRRRNRLKTTLTFIFNLRQEWKGKGINNVYAGGDLTSATKVKWLAPKEFCLGKEVF